MDEAEPLTPIPGDTMRPREEKIESTTRAGDLEFAVEGNRFIVSFPDQFQRLQNLVVREHQSPEDNGSNDNGNIAALGATYTMIHEPGDTPHRLLHLLLKFAQSEVN